MNNARQFIDPRRIVKQLEMLHVPRYTLAALLGISEPLLSLWVSRQRSLSLVAQKNVLEIMEFLEHVTSRSQLPVDFSKADALRPELEKFRHAKIEHELSRSVRAEV